MYRPTEDDFISTAGSNTSGSNTASGRSDERMRRPDHKAKKHGKPRRGEKIGGGYFVFGRRNGRIAPAKFPFEHDSLDGAVTEATRLRDKEGRSFEVYQRVSVVEGV